MKRKKIIKILLFPIPFLLLFLINFFVDPFNFNGLLDMGLNKANVSYNSNHRLWKIVEFHKKPYPNILLGDSRINNFDTKYIKSLTGEQYYNFAYNGCTLDEIIDTFWLAANYSKIKNVYIGINFNLFNRYNNMNLVKESVKRLECPILKYYFNFWIFKVSLNNLLFKFCGLNIYSEKINMSKEDFWLYHLKEIVPSFYKKYSFPKNNIENLFKIKKYCNDNGINLFFIIPPTHVDSQIIVREFNLSSSYDRYKRILKEISPVFDFELENEMCKNKDNFSDPFHFNRKIMLELCDKIFK